MGTSKELLGLSDCTMFRLELLKVDFVYFVLSGIILDGYFSISDGVLELDIEGEFLEFSKSLNLVKCWDGLADVLPLCNLVVLDGAFDDVLGFSIEESLSVVLF